MTPRVLVPGPHRAGARVALDDGQSHHLARVLRLRDGDALELFDGDGHRWRATLASASARAALVEVGTPLPSPPDGPLRITLLQGLSAAERMDWTIEKAVELGVARIVPLGCARSVVRLDAERAQRRAAHWQRLVVAACTQCGRDRLPQLEPVSTPAAAFAADARLPIERLMLAAPREAGEAPGARSAASRTTDEVAGPAAAAATPLALSQWRPRGTPADAPLEVALLVGPEAGLDDAEVDMALRAGFVPVRVGPRTLRTETAALAAAAALQGRFGDF